MTGSVLQINISPGGVPKLPITEARVTRHGIVGDSWAHPQFHGGPDKALLLITSEGIEELKQSGYPLFSGALGENITTAGLDRKQMRIGQRWRIGDVVFQFTSVRVACNTLKVYGAGMKEAVYDKRVKAGDVESPVWGLSGFYATVIQGGTIRRGDIIALVDHVV